MSCFILSKRSYEYLKEKATYYLYEHRYNLSNTTLRYGNWETIKNYVNVEVNKLFKLNYKAYNSRYQMNKAIEKAKYDSLPSDKIEEPVLAHYELSQKEKMQTYFLIECMAYQIEDVGKWDKRFYELVSSMLAKDLAYKMIEDYNEVNKDKIEWGI